MCINIINMMQLTSSMQNMLVGVSCLMFRMNAAITYVCFIHDFSFLFWICCLNSYIISQCKNKTVTYLCLFFSQQCNFDPVWLIYTKTTSIMHLYFTLFQNVTIQLWIICFSPLNNAILTQCDEIRCIDSKCITWKIHPKILIIYSIKS